MSEDYCDVNGCEYCRKIPVSNYYGARLCDNCIEMERNTDWDAYEEKKRKRIAEENEY
ncbi:hypothetical protein [Alteromonas sp.]|uniref:hypothetical protein n=1 Tax=Alteromonas sp. TaxID=232 RepID=UPI0025799EEC|nr:hypothetical protein [Alteromonas sp.]NQY17727.1 hypothetical protein [Alteromonas sp.]